jgi:hypothetical protein
MDWPRHRGVARGGMTHVLARRTPYDRPTGFQNSGHNRGIHILELISHHFQF